MSFTFKNDKHKCNENTIKFNKVCNFVVRDFELDSFYYVIFRTNTLRKGMKPPHTLLLKVKYN